MGKKQSRNTVETSQSSSSWNIWALAFFLLPLLATVATILMAFPSGQRLLQRVDRALFGEDTSTDPLMNNPRANVSDPTPKTIVPGPIAPTLMPETPMVPPVLVKQEEPMKVPPLEPMVVTKVEPKLPLVPQPMPMEKTEESVANKLTPPTPPAPKNPPDFKEVTPADLEKLLNGK